MWISVWGCAEILTQNEKIYIIKNAVIYNYDINGDYA